MCRHTHTLTQPYTRPHTLSPIHPQPHTATHQTHDSADHVPYTPAPAALVHAVRCVRNCTPVYIFLCFPAPAPGGPRRPCGPPSTAGPRPCTVSEDEGWLCLASARQRQTQNRKRGPGHPPPKNSCEAGPGHGPRPGPQAYVRGELSSFFQHRGERGGPLSGSNPRTSSF